MTTSPTATLLDLAREAVISARGCLTHPCGAAGLENALELLRAATRPDWAGRGPSELPQTLLRLRCILAGLRVVWNERDRVQVLSEFRAEALGLVRIAEDALRAFEAGETDR